MRQRVRATTSVVLAVTLLLIATGCGMTRLGRELKTIKRGGTVEGRVEGSWDRDQFAVVGLYRASPTGYKLARYKLHYLPGSYVFQALEPGKYLIVAFRDVNGDLAYQPGEPVADSSHRVMVPPGRRVEGRDLRFGAATGRELGVSFDLSDPASQAAMDFERISRGEVTTIDDERFTAKNGTLGLWEPLKFLDEVGGGFFLLEPYDPAKVPVLFVHGIGGNPSDFAYLVEHLDHERFQPWVVFYPSAVQLDTASEFVIEVIKDLYSEHRFERLFVVAHSMGGLVSRSFINKVVERDPEDQVIRLFVTISTPWRGHDAARMGVRFATAVVPAWVDMVPGSPFQEALLEQPLPSEIPYYLLFSYGGGNSAFAEGPDDGTVSVSSELHLPLQRDAVKVMGFNESHSSILETPEVSEYLNEILSNTLADNAKGPME